MLAVEVCLLIYAHESHTVSCNMEGISAVLQTTRILVDKLKTRERFQLMVALLTGIGRYSEMTYIFDILAESGEFVRLLGKNTYKVGSSRIIDLKRTPH